MGVYLAGATMSNKPYTAVNLFLLAMLVVVIITLYVKATFIVLSGKLDVWTKRRTQEQVKAFAAAQRVQEKKLEKIRASMTDAEWAAYEIQLENKKLLEEIKRNQGNSSGTTTSFKYGVIDQ